MMPAKVVKTSADMSRMSLENADLVAGTARGVCTSRQPLGSLARTGAAGGHALSGRRMVNLVRATLRVPQDAYRPQDRQDDESDRHVRIVGPGLLEQRERRNRQRCQERETVETEHTLPSRRPLTEVLEVVLHRGADAFGRSRLDEQSAEGKHRDEEQREPPGALVCVGGHAYVIEQPNSNAVHGVRLEKESRGHVRSWRWGGSCGAESSLSFDVRSASQVTRRVMQ